ncbi:hypothetical protein [Paraburkholderia phenoliruptrix]|uniref:hypothetical protein n=1 Tax=Paraburkholderia phenoliruptrix TaxID=252970 RepID=UPI0034CF4FFC
MSQLFKSLLDELEGLNQESVALTKALPADNGKDKDKIQAAAGEGGGDAGGGKDPDADPDADPNADPDNQPVLGKSMVVKDAEGNDVEALDATEILKSLAEDMDMVKGVVAEGGVLAKALEQTVGLVKSQGVLIKSLQEQVAKLSGEGRGRKAVLTLTEKIAPTLAKSQQQDDGMTPQEFMVKSQAAFTAKRITGQELTVIDVSLRENVAIDAGLIQKVLA